MSKRRDKFDHAKYAAPFRQRLPGPDGGLGPEYLPISARSGRAVAQSTAERDWAQSFRAVPTKGHDAGGMWDHEEERRLRGRAKVPLTLPRYDEVKMAAFFARHGSALTGHQWEIYTRFWVKRQSYAAIARELGRRRERVYEAIKDLRVRAVGVY